jgi:hypothetical protein
MGPGTRSGGEIAGSGDGPAGRSGSPLPWNKRCHSRAVPCSPKGRAGLDSWRRVFGLPLLHLARQLEGIWVVHVAAAPTG